MGDSTNKLLSSLFPGAAGPIRSKENNYTAPRRTNNPKAKPTSRGRDARSKRQRNLEAEAASFANQQQLQADQFKFLKDNIFNKSSATRRTISGQIEQPQPQGLDYFKNTGADRPEVIARKAALDAQGLNQPGVWEGAQAAVNRQKQVQGWADPNTPPPQPAGPDMNQYLRTNTRSMDVFDNPQNNVVNPHTGLTTNTGPFVRSRPNPYGSARAVFGPNTQPQAPASQPSVPSAPAGPVQQMFSPPADLTPPRPMWNQSDVAQPPPPTFPNWQDMPSGPERSMASVANNQESGITTWLKNLFSAPGLPYPLDRIVSPTFDPITSQAIGNIDLTNMPQVSLPNAPWQRDRIVDPNNPNNLITQPNWWDNLAGFVAQTMQTQQAQPPVSYRPLGY